MLQVSGAKHDAKADVEVDPYVPLTIVFDGGGDDTPLYWRGRTDEGSLVEVGVSSKDGAIRSVTLTSISRRRVTLSGLGHEVQAGAAGVPQVDLSPWPAERRHFADNFVDENVSMNLFIGESTATLYFLRCPEALSWQQLDNISFGVTDDGFLCCIEVAGLSDEQVATIAAAAGA
jgi:hypothetical protein